MLSRNTLLSSANAFCLDSLPSFLPLLICHSFLLTLVIALLRVNYLFLERGGGESRFAVLAKRFFFKFVESRKLFALTS